MPNDIMPPKALVLPVMFGPKRGRAFWEREVGAGDEPGPPVSADVPRRLVASDQPVAVAWAP